VGGLASGEEDPLVVHARIVRDRCELSVDTCGPALHRRGWRQQTAKAPLREDLAHALLRVGGWQPSMALIDPMMGSGTVVIEAARMARRIAPGRDRTFAFERMPGFDAGLWARLVREATVQERPAPTRIIGRDCERGAVEAARGNATRAGVLDGLELRQVELEAESLDGAEMIACNPPYGKRVGRGEGDVKRVWKALADAIARAASVRHIALVVPDRSLLRGTSLRLQPRLLTDHGGIKVEFMTQ
jgi:putative N6-adenine-specific DNA methylase